MSAVFEIRTSVVEPCEPPTIHGWYVYRALERRAVATTDPAYWTMRCPVCERRYNIPADWIAVSIEGLLSVAKNLRCPTFSCGFYVSIELGIARELPEMPFAFD